MAAVKLALYVTGVYVCFLTWGVLQERITTTAYAGIDGTSERFSSFVVLNMVQGAIGAGVAMFVLLWFNMGIGCQRGYGILGHFAKVALTISVASPFGYASLKHINFPTMMLGKSCKLLPVMSMNMLIYRKRFAWFKYVSVLLITLGVSGFMLFDPKAASKTGRSNSWFGLGLLFFNLLIDGVTNSWQDEIFLKYDVRSQHMMLWMNVFSVLFMLVYTASPFSGYQLMEAVQFCSTHPTVWKDLVLFGLCGSLGQVFIFGLLEEFGSLTLVTVTVTRKLFTILLSLFWFNHAMAPIQWAFVAIVFAGIAFDATMKYREKQKSVVTAYEGEESKKRR